MHDTAIAHAEHAGDAPALPAWCFYQPYGDFDADFAYNALFCDCVALLRRDRDAPCDERWSGVLAADPAPDLLRSTVADLGAPSRLRALAAHRLALLGQEIAGPAVLGVVVEIPHALRQETLAAFADGSVRYIRSSGEKFRRPRDRGRTRAQAHRRRGAARRALRGRR